MRNRCIEVHVCPTISVYCVWLRIICNDMGMFWGCISSYSMWHAMTCRTAVCRVGYGNVCDGNAWLWCCDGHRDVICHVEMCVFVMRFRIALLWYTVGYGIACCIDIWCHDVLYCCMRIWQGYGTARLCYSVIVILRVVSCYMTSLCCRKKAIVSGSK